MRLLRQPVESVVLSGSAPNPDPLQPGETLLARIRRRGVIRVGYNEDSLPFAYVNEDGRLVGFDVNMAHALATDLGDTVKRIDGTEVPILTPWLGKDGKAAATKAAPNPPKAPAPAKPAVKQAAEAKAKENAPETLSAARDGKADDLKLLKGVGPKLEQTLNELGFYHFDQIAAWTPDQVAWVDARLKFKGRIERDGWIEQAGKLAAGEETEFAKRAKKDGTYEE